MTARLLRSLTIGLLAIAAAWTALWWRAGYPLTAVLGAAFLMVSHGLVLGLEFILAGAARGEDASPPPSRRERLCAWWQELLLDLVVFCWYQPFRAAKEPDFLLLPPHPHEGLHGVVLIHGFACNRGFWNLWMPQLRAAGIPHIAINLEPPLASIDGYTDAIESAVARIETCTGQPAVIVAHSMGGLAVRAWLRNVGMARRIHRVVTIATPHAGTRLARFAWSRNGRQMRIGSRWLQQLRAEEPDTLYGSFTCYHSHCDNVVFPPRQATLPGADNRHLLGMAHVQMAYAPEVFQHVVLWAKSSADAAEFR